MEVLLAPEETETLLEVLRSYSADLRMEIIDTDNPGYKRPLKHQREVIDGIVEKLHAMASAGAVEAGSAVGLNPSTERTVGRVSLRVIAVW